MEPTMTFLPLAELERRRAAGTSPMGGPGIDYSEISGRLPAAPQARLDALLDHQFDHPMNDSVMAAIRELTRNHSRATVLTAAEVVRDRTNKVESREIAKAAYAALVAGLSVR